MAYRSYHGSDFHDFVYSKVYSGRLKLSVSAMKIISDNTNHTSLNHTVEYVVLQVCSIE